MGMARVWSDEEDQIRFPESLPGAKPKPQPQGGWASGPPRPTPRYQGWRGPDGAMYPSRSHYHSAQEQAARNEVEGVQNQRLAGPRAVPQAQFSQPETLPATPRPAAPRPPVAAPPAAAAPPPKKPAPQAPAQGQAQNQAGEEQQQPQGQAGQYQQPVHPGVAMQQQGLAAYQYALDATNKAWGKEMDSRVAQAKDQADRDHEANIARMALQSKQSEQQSQMAMMQQASQAREQRNSALLQAAGIGGTKIVNGRKVGGFSPFRSALLG